MKAGGCLSQRSLRNWCTSQKSSLMIEMTLKTLDPAGSLLNT